MVATWTEAFSSFTPAGTGWQNYDLFTNKSVPKGAIAHIAIGSVNQTAARTVGVRTDGSALSRFVKLHESEGTTTGACFATFYVKTDASTGIIETYADNVTGITFYLLGYWTGVNYTELMATLSPGTVSTWTDKNVNTGQSVPLGSVCEIMLNNRQDGAATTMGVRTNGSALTRSVSVHEAESSSVETTDGTTFSMCVKCNATDGIIEIYQSNLTSDVFLLGYFDVTKLTYIEGIQTGAITATGWTDWDLTAYLDQDGRVVEVLCANSATAANYDFGVRKNGSALNRYLNIHESETNATNGFVTAAETDTGGIVELYGSNAANEFFRYLGYFKPMEKDVITTDGIGLSEFIKTDPTRVTVTDAIGLVDVVNVLQPWLMGKDASAVTLKSNANTEEPVGMNYQRRCFRSQGRYWCLIYMDAYNLVALYSRTDKGAMTDYGGGFGDNSAQFGLDGKSCMVYFLTESRGSRGTGAAIVMACYNNTWKQVYAYTGAVQTDGSFTQAGAASPGGMPARANYGGHSGVTADGLPALVTPDDTPNTLVQVADAWGFTGSWTALDDGSTPGNAFDASGAGLVLPSASSGVDLMLVRAVAGSPLTLKARRYTGGAWATDTTICSDLATVSSWAALEHANDVYVIYVKHSSTNHQVCFKKWTSAGGWGSEETVDSASANEKYPTCTYGAVDDAFYAIWSDGLDLNANKRKTAGTWGGVESLWTMGSGGVRPSSAPLVDEYGQVMVTWLEGSAGSWNVKGAWFKVEATAIIVTDVLYLSDAITSPMHMVAVDTIVDTDSIRKSPENWVITETTGLWEFSLSYDYTFSYPEWATSDTGSSAHQYPCCYQNHVFRPKESYERIFVFCHDGRYFKHTSSPDFYGTDTSTTYGLIDDHGVGAGDDKKDDVFWDSVNLRWRTAFLTGTTIYIRTGTPAYPGAPAIYITWSGQTSAYSNAGEVQSEVCCAYADSTFWLGFIETSGGSGDKYPKVKSSATWGSFGSNIIVDNSNGNCSAMKILNCNGSTVKAAILYVTGTTAGSYSIRMKHYSGGSLQNVGLVCSDLYGPNAWSASSDDNGNIYVVWVYGATGQGIKYVRIANGVVGTIKTVATAPDTGDGSSWSDVTVGISVDKRCDRQLAFFAYYNASSYSYSRYVGMTGEAPYISKVQFSSWASGWWAYLAAERNCGTYDVWASLAHSSYYNYAYLLNLPSVVQKFTLDSMVLTDVANLVTAVAQTVLDAIGLADSVLVGKTPTTTADAIGLVDAIFRGKEVVETDSIGVVDVVNVLKTLLIYITDAIGLSDEAPVQKFKTILDSIALLDSGTRDKALTILENLYLTDADYRGKEVVELDSIGLTDALVKLMTGLIIESITLSDVGLRDKTLIPIQDSITIDDQGLKTRYITISESIGMADGPKTDKDLTIASDSIILSDQTSRDKLLMIVMDALALADSKLVNKTAFVQDVLQTLDAILLSKGVIAQDQIGLQDLALSGKAQLIVDAMLLSDQGRLDKNLILYEGIRLSSPKDYSDPNLILATNMETLTAGGLLKDLTGLGHDGTENGGVRAGEADKAISGGATFFDAIDDYIQIDDKSDLTLADELTISMWVYPKSSDKGIIDKGWPWGSWGLKTSGSYFLVEMAGWMGWAPTTVELNQWQHIAIVFKKPDVWFYKNGIMYGPATRNISNSASGQPLLIGADWVWHDPPGWYIADQFYDGYIDEVSISKIARTASEIRAEYEESVLRNKAVVILESTGLLDEESRPFRSFPISDDLLLSAELIALTKQLLTSDSISLSEVVTRVRTGIVVLRRLRGELTAADVDGQTPPEQHIKGERRDEDLEGETEKKDAQGRETKKYWQQGLKE